MSPLPPQNQQQLTESFADVVDVSTKSVVNIQTTSAPKSGGARGTPRQHPFFDDEFLRRFFGQPTPPPGGQNRPRMHSLGSGVIVSPDGYILTNNHVIEGADQIKVMLNDGKTEYTAKLVGADPRTDLALLKIDAKNLPAIPFGDSERLRVGDIVLAIGNPFGLGQTVTMGIISATGRAIGVADLENFIQTDAAINQGNSGGALVDAQGRLIGINNAIFSQSGGNIGIGFAIPVNMAKNIMERLIKDGKVIRGYLGVMIQPVSPDMAAMFKLPDTSGALVGDVIKGSGAEAAGIKRGDVITAFDGQKIRDDRHLRLLASQTSPGKKVSVTAVRDGKPRAFQVTLKPLPDEKTAAAEGQPSPGAEPEKLFEGVELSELDNQLRAQARAPRNLQGLYVANVEPDSAAAEAGLRPGDIIQEINRRPVTDLTSALTAKKANKSKSTLVVVWNDGSTRFIVVNE
nr:DegQ family serine endoprotease [Oscillatoria laete-virens]